METCRQAGIADIVVVASPQTETPIRSVLGDIRIALQPEPKGTGDAARCGLSAIAPDGIVVVLAGDTPCMRPVSLAAVIAGAKAGNIAVLTAELANPGGYGRIVRDADGSIARIVEDKDATASEKKIGEINSGLYAFPVAVLRRHLAELKPNNAQGELYLVDVIALARAAGVKTMPVAEGAADDIQGVNDRIQLAAAEKTLRQRINAAWQAAGVTLRDPDSTVIEPDVRLAADVELGPSVHLLRRTQVDEGSSIGQGSILSDTLVGANCTVKPYVVAERAVLGSGVSVGPFAHLREGTDLRTRSRVGNFVETKKTVLGEGSKANHLAYLGDATIGANVNVGAGTITCNYDGANKHATTIDDDVFVGSDTQFVAPVHVGKGATIGAGTTVTRDVPAGALAVSRAPQKEIPGYRRKRKAG